MSGRVASRQFSGRFLSVCANCLVKVSAIRQLVVAPPSTPPCEGAGGTSPPALRLASKWPNKALLACWPPSSAMVASNVGWVALLGATTITGAGGGVGAEVTGGGGRGVGVGVGVGVGAVSARLTCVAVVLTVCVNPAVGTVPVTEAKLPLTLEALSSV